MPAERRQPPPTDSPASGDDERRRGPDRRRRPTPFLSRYWLTGRRRGNRRGEERGNHYVDRYTRGEWLLVGSVVLLSLIDLLATLAYLDAGGEEWNPVMSVVLASGHGVFAAVKMGVTVIGMLVVLAHIRFGTIRRAAQVLLVLYCLLTGYHLYLRFHLSAIASAIAPASGQASGSGAEETAGP